MRYLALATDYDGTLAHDGRVDEAFVLALRRLKESGRRLLLVTGRELDELLEIFPEIEVFDLVVAENGALLYNPATREERVIGDPPPPELVEALRQEGVGPISVGRSIIATWEPHQTTVLEVIRRLGLEHQVIFNKGAVMVLPAGTNKASGMAVALAELGLSPHNVVGIGDAENDHAFLSICEASVAVSNALDALKERVDWVTEGDHGRGVMELIERLEAEDLESLGPALSRHEVLLGHDVSEEEVRVSPYGETILIAGTSGSGKSTLTTGLMERLVEAGYQLAIIDPEGDYASLDFAVTLGDTQHAPSAEEVVQLLDQTPDQNAVVNLLGVALADRPAFSDRLLPELQQLRSRTGRPHWLVVDEAHHLMPSAWDPTELTLPLAPRNLVAITVHPESVSLSLLARVTLVLAIGLEPEATIDRFCKALGRPSPRIEPTELERGQAMAWWPGRDDVLPKVVTSVPPKTERLRHSRKYAEGNLGPDRSFYFRGPTGALNLRAQNLHLFLQMAEGVDDATWQFHLEQGDYARWFREQVKDDELSQEAEALASKPGLDPNAGRQALRAAIEARYTLPAEPAEAVTDPTKFG